MKVLMVIAVMLILAAMWYGYEVQIFKSESSLPSPTPKIVLTPTPLPMNLPTKYISEIDWPPKLTIEHIPFSCEDPAKLVTVNGHNYCVSEESQGAAGSIYTKYIYARAKDDQMEEFSFTLRFVQCANYPEPEKTECENLTKNFNVDNFADQYIQTLRAE